VPRSIVPQVIPAVHALMASAVDSDVYVLIGPPGGANVPDKYVAVGYGGDDRAGVTGTGVEVPGYNTGEFWAENIEIWCTVSTASGDQDGAAQLAETQAIFDLVQDAVDADPKLGGLLVNESRMTAGGFEWTIDDGGAVCTVFFVLLIEARWIPGA
jgi:hypothetical protein